MAETKSSAGPLVWLLTDDRPGNRSQAVGTARALGRPYAEKRLAFNDRSERATPRLGATLATLDEASRALIAPPWPDLVIGAGRRVAPVAAHVKAASGGRTRVVLVGRRTPAAFADLTIRCSYFTQAPDPRLLTLDVPPAKVDAAALAEAAAALDPLPEAPRPRAVALIGGPTGRHLFDDGFAESLARDLAAAAAERNVSLAVVTSRRTPASAVAAIRRGAPAATVRDWRPDAPADEIPAILARADLLVVTGESESMLAEAVASGRPLTIVPLRERPAGWKQRVRDAIARAALGSGPFSALGRRAMGEGWVSPRRELARLHEVIEARGWGRVFAGALNVSPPAVFDQDRLVRARILALLPASGAEDAA